jgi:hypothetical protein
VARKSREENQAPLSAVLLSPFKRKPKWRGAAITSRRHKPATKSHLSRGEENTQMPTISVPLKNRREHFG